jgi:hypothetical protein
MPWPVPGADGTGLGFWERLIVVQSVFCDICPTISQYIGKIVVMNY